MYTRTQGCSLAVVFALVAAHASASPQSPVPTPIVEVGAAWLRHIAYSADGGLLAALTDEGLELLDADTYETVAWVGRGGHGVSPQGW